MKTKTTILFTFALLLSLFAVSVSCSRSNDPVKQIEQPNPDPDPDPDPEPEPEPFVLTDLAEKAMALAFENPDQSLVLFYFTEEPGKVMVHWRHSGNNYDFTCRLKEGNKVEFGTMILTFAKDNQGKITATDVVCTNTDFVAASFVLYEASAAPNFRAEGKLFKENDNSYMRFSQDKWGWGSTPNVTQDRNYLGIASSPNLYFKGASSLGQHVGVMIPAGVKWNSDTGPLMLVWRRGILPAVFIQQ